MKRITLRNAREEYDSVDVTRIVKAFASRGLLCTREQAEFMWYDYSELLAATWIHLPETDDEIMECLSEHYLEVDEDRPINIFG